MFALTKLLTLGERSQSPLILKSPIEVNVNGPDLPKDSHGYAFCPDAFEGSSLEGGKRVISHDAFYRLYVSYLLHCGADKTQLIHFREKLVILEVSIMGEKSPLLVQILWCALSFCTDRYFAELARDCALSVEDVTGLRTAWYEFIDIAFLPIPSNTRLDAKKFNEWSEKMISVRRQEIGPLPGCRDCTSACLYRTEASAFAADSNLEYQWNTQVCADKNVTATAATASFCRVQSIALMGKFDIDFAHCLALHLIPKAVGARELMNIAEKVRARLILFKDL